MNEKECKYGGGSPNSYEAPLVEIEEIAFEEPLIIFKSRLIGDKIVTDKVPSNCGFFVGLDEYFKDKSNNKFNENIYRDACGFYGAKLFYKKRYDGKNGIFFKAELNTDSREVKEIIKNIEISNDENEKSAYLRQFCLYTIVDFLRKYFESSRLTEYFIKKDDRGRDTQSIQHQKL